jgi:hypothetical protein
LAWAPVQASPRKGIDKQPFLSADCQVSGGSFPNTVVVT